MNSRQNIFQNLTTLTKFEPTTPRKIYYVNCLTTYDTMAELFKLVKQKNQFAIETKYDNIAGCPKLIQILFAHKFKLHIILVETLYLTDSDLCLHHQMQCLFSIILSPTNEIQSWNDIKTELKYFLDCNLFTWTQTENINAVNIQHKFQSWFRKNFSNIELNCVPSNNCKLEMAIAFLCQQYLDTSLLKSHEWNIGLFAQFDTNCDEKLFSHNRRILKLVEDNKRRISLSQYAIYECMAVNKVASVLQNNWTRKNAENYLKKYYNNF